MQVEPGKVLGLTVLVILISALNTMVYFLSNFNIAMAPSKYKIFDLRSFAMSV